ncbi:hypothetical protein, partial [Stenotrophomonas maltophilia]|uniref:hypothetical protein n=1 Tax=Stenotrophomonas maltophilia TaxID=40324 RepID=UPI001953D46A
ESTCEALEAYSPPGNGPNHFLNSSTQRLDRAKFRPQSSTDPASGETGSCRLPAASSGMSTRLNFELRMAIQIPSFS